MISPSNAVQNNISLNYKISLRKSNKFWLVLVITSMLLKILFFSKS